MVKCYCWPTPLPSNFIAGATKLPYPFVDTFYGHLV